MMLRWQERKEVMKSRIYPRGLISGEREISINANIFKQKVSPKFQFKDNFLEPSFGDISKRLQRQSRPSYQYLNLSLQILVSADGGQVVGGKNLSLKYT